MFHFEKECTINCSWLFFIYQFQQNLIVLSIQQADEVITMHLLSFNQTECVYCSGSQLDCEPKNNQSSVCKGSHRTIRMHIREETANVHFCVQVCVSIYNHNRIYSNYAFQHHLHFNFFPSITNRMHTQLCQ